MLLFYANDTMTMVSETRKDDTLMVGCLLFGAIWRHTDTQWRQKMGNRKTEMRSYGRYGGTVHTYLRIGRMRRI